MMILYLLFLLLVVCVAGFALGAVLGFRARVVFVALGAMLLALVSFVFVYNMYLLPVQYAHMGPGSERIALRKTAVDFAMGKLLAEYLMYASLATYAVGFLVGLKRKKKGTADETSH